MASPSHYSDCPLHPFRTADTPAYLVVYFLLLGRPIEASNPSYEQHLRRTRRLEETCVFTTTIHKNLTILHYPKSPNRYLIPLAPIFLSTFLFLLILFHKHSLLRTPKLTIQTIAINKILMRSTLCHITLSQHDDNIRVVNRAETMGDKDGRATLLFDERVDV